MIDARKLKVLIIGNIASSAIERLQNQPELDVIVNTDLTHSELVSIIEEYDVLISRYSNRIDHLVIENAKSLKLIGQASRGVDNIDINLATNRRIKVVAIDSGNGISAAEHTMLMILATSRNFYQIANKLKHGIWSKLHYRGYDVFGKTLGIIGLGRIGSHVSKLANSFGMKVIAYDPYIPYHRFDLVNSARCNTLEQLVEYADIITIHVPLNTETYHLISRELLAKFRNESILINCARGEIVDEQALLDYLNDGKFRAVGLDVFHNEPNPRLDLLSHEKVVVSPHIAGVTVESLDRVSQSLVSRILSDLDLT